VTYTRYLIEPLPAGEGSQRERERALAYDLLCRLLDEEKPHLEHDDKGRPFLPDHPELYISISHCSTAVAVAVSPEGRVGIDVECRRKIGDGLLERVCTADEQAVVRAAADPTMTFLQLWTRKEAVLKLRGTGIQGFGSMVDALTATDCHVMDIDTRLPDTVAAISYSSAN
jgi:phosphopantetheinyl transferase